MFETGSAVMTKETAKSDRGCDVFARCLECPLPSCVEDEARGRQRVRLAARNNGMVALRQRGQTTREIAEVFGVSRRTVERALRKRRLGRQVIRRRAAGVGK